MAYRRALRICSYRPNMITRILDTQMYTLRTTNDALAIMLWRFHHIIIIRNGM